MNTPLISVCIAAFNAEKFLETTLRTIQAQSFKNWEVIVTEDGSKDRTEDHVLDFSIKVPQRVVYNRHPLNRGLPATRNTGIATAEGDWVAFLDADDLWKPNHLESLVSASQIDDGDAVYSGSILYDDATWTKLSTLSPSDDDLTNLPLALYSGRLSIMSSSVMIKRASIEKFGPFSSDFPLCSDAEYWLRILSKGGQMIHSATNTCIYRQHDNALSRRKAPNLTESARVCERYARWNAIPRRMSRTRPASLYRLAGRTLMTENPTAALAPFTQSLRLQPLAPKTLGLWAKAFFQKNSRRQRAA
jgi:glycosyltransferase involved in cell wall biosynthesis